MDRLLQLAFAASLLYRGSMEHKGKVAVVRIPLNYETTHEVHIRKGRFVQYVVTVKGPDYVQETTSTCEVKATACLSHLVNNR